MEWSESQEKSVFEYVEKLMEICLESSVCLESDNTKIEWEIGKALGGRGLDQSKVKLVLLALSLFVIFVIFVYFFATLCPRFIDFVQTGSRAR